MKPPAIFLLLAAALLLLAAAPAPAPRAQAYDPNPPTQPVKLIFIHHSTGENWLTDGYGDLGRTLDRNNYFVSDTNYGWGPDAIGDRTDIPDWIEWFSSGETERYMQALLAENGQHSSYTRTLSDPGGENQVIMFKSCFPNSALEGSPGDPPDSGGGLTVGHAKYVYDEILGYFANRPDKLFVVVTAPPLSDPAYAANARAFNQWLVNDWLSQYPLSNVVIFDFYNVLTGSGHHHRFSSGQIEHTFVPGADTLAYPSGDDHPSEAGSRKASEEFVPLLNVYYNRWRMNAAPGPLPTYQAPAPPAVQPPVPGVTSGAAALAGFEAGEPAWEAYRDETTPTTIACAPESGSAYAGSAALRLDFNVSPNAWATCARMYESPQDWSAAPGLAFQLRAGQAGLVFNVDLYAGPPEARETYLYTLETPPDAAQGWIPITLTWDQFHRADWEADAGTPFARSNQVSGMAFGFNTYPDTPNTGVLWVDELRLSGGEQTPAQPAPTQEQPAQPAAPEPERPGRRLPFCGSALLLPLFVLLLAWRNFLRG